MISERKAKILIADDHVIVRAGLELLLDSHFPICKLFFASDFWGIEKVLMSQKIDLLILDIDFGEDTSMEFIPKIFALQKSIKILTYTGLDESLLGTKFFNLGVSGFLSKNSGEKDVVKAVEGILSGKTYRKGKVVNKEPVFIEQNTNPLKVLSKREMEITLLYAQGNGNLEIANKLGVRTNTISTFKKRILEKLNIETIHELITIYEVYR